jgi:uncharacterized membrane protein YqgA involved in biofilm formation
VLDTIIDALGIGTVLNAAGIVIGGVLGLTMRKPLSPANQTFFKVVLGAATVYCGLRLTWLSVNGSFLQMLKQVVIVLLAMMLGKFTGRLMRLQKTSNRLGQYARDRMERATPANPHRWGDGFNTCALLFCVAPLAFLGAVQDGLSGYYQPLLIKALMDGLATMAFVAAFGWGAVLAALPVLACQGTIALLARSAEPFLRGQGLVDSIGAVGGLLIFCVALIILELKKIELTDYLPSLAFAPLIAWLWR